MRVESRLDGTVVAAEISADHRRGRLVATVPPKIVYAVAVDPHGWSVGALGVGLGEGGILQINGPDDVDGLGQLGIGGPNNTSYSPDLLGVLGLNGVDLTGALDDPGTLGSLGVLLPGVANGIYTPPAPSPFPTLPGHTGPWGNVPSRGAPNSSTSQPYGDGTLTSTYDQGGALTKQEYETTDNGVTTTTTFDGNGQKKETWERTSNADGTGMSRVTEFDGAGHVTERTVTYTSVSKPDQNGDRVEQSVSNTTTYDKDGQQTGSTTTVTKRVVDKDGKTKSEQTRTVVYDKDGKVVSDTGRPAPDDGGGSDTDPRLQLLQFSRAQAKAGLRLLLVGTPHSDDDHPEEPIPPAQRIRKRLGKAIAAAAGPRGDSTDYGHEGGPVLPWDRPGWGMVVSVGRHDSDDYDTKSPRERTG